MDNEEKIKEILEENAKLKEELQATKEHLKKYTAPSYKKEYYENNKDTIKALSASCRHRQVDRKSVV